MSRAARTFAIMLACGLFAVSVGAAVIAQQQQAADHSGQNTPTASYQFYILVTTIAGVASMLATQFFQIYRENRNRKWDIADRAAAREEMRKHAETQRLETIEAAVTLAQVSNINNEHLLGAIDKNTDITKAAANQAQAAYVAANNFNEKIEALHQKLVEATGKKKEPHSGNPAPKGS